MPSPGHPDRTSPSRRGLFSALLAAGVVLALPVDAPAQSAMGTRGALFSPPAGQAGPAGAPPVARYMSETGVRFTFDRSQGLPLVKFDRSPEVWVLRPQPGILAAGVTAATLSYGRRRWLALVPRQAVHPSQGFPTD